MLELADPAQRLREELARVRAQSLKPQPRIHLDEWADQFRFLSAEAASMPGRWRTEHVEVARGPMRAITDPAVHTVTVMCPTQMLKTELVLNTIGYHVHQDPAPIIVMQPTVHMAEAFAKDRVEPMLRDTPVLRDAVPPKKSRDGGNTILHKQFPGGHLTMIGANAPGELAMRPVRIVLRDEVDKYPQDVGKEGDPLAIIAERAATFWNYKIVNACSPTIQGRSVIEREYHHGDQRVFESPCPHCGAWQEMRWANVKWPKFQPEKAAYHCAECEKPWSEHERLLALRVSRWRATQPFNGHASFHCTKLSSPWQPVHVMAEKWEKAQGQQSLLKVFVNTQLAETWKEKGEAPEWQRLYERRVQFKRNVVPRGGLLLTAGCDVQRDRLEVEVMAWGRKHHTWPVDYRVFMGDTSDIETMDSPWRKLEAMLAEQWASEYGVPMALHGLAVDSGDQTQTVYAWCRKQPANRVMATKGVETAAALLLPPKAVDVNWGGKRVARGLKLWTVCTDMAKSELYGWLRQDRPLDDAGVPVVDDALLPTGWCHFPDWLDAEYFKQLTAEQLVARIVRGYRRYSWEKTRDRNEALDVRVLNRAVACMLGIDRFSDDTWAALEHDVAAESVKTREQNVNASQPEQPRSDDGGGFLGGRGSFWR